MSLNLTVPMSRDSPAAKERGASKQRRAKSPSIIIRPHPNSRAKSKSPNPSFCSVLSRVKDWELGAFTPKTALADNVDVMNKSNIPFSDSDREMSAKESCSDPWRPSPTGSPTPEENALMGAATAANLPLSQAAAAVATAENTTSGGGKQTTTTSGLLKSALSSNISKF